MWINDYLRLIRVPNDLMVGIGVLIGEYIALKSFPSLEKALYGFLVGFLISASVMITNDIADIEIDKINNPEKPLVKGAIKINSAYRYAFVIGIIGVIFSYLTSFYNLIIALLFWIIGILYNFYFKKHGLIGNVIVSSSVAIPFVYGGVAVNSLDLNVILLSIAAFLTNTYREIIKGIIDIEGDKEFNVHTLAVKYGPDRAYSISLIFLAGAIIVSLIPFLCLSLPNLIFYAFLIGLTDLTLIYSAIIIRNGGRFNVSSLKFSKRVCLLGMFLGMLSFVVGVI